MNIIILENLYCSNFKAADIHYLLCGYDEHYQKLLINIYEPVPSEAIGCVLADTDIRRLEITPAAISRFNRLFARKNKNEILNILTEAADELKQTISLSDNLEPYIKNSLVLISTLIENAVTKGRKYLCNNIHN